MITWTLSFGKQFIITNNPENKWPEADKEIWDRLGGKEYLSMMLQAEKFTCYQHTYRSKQITLHVKSASCIFLDEGGRKRLFKVTESYMKNTLSPIPNILIIDVRPVIWSIDWFLWIIDKNGDRDESKHRSEISITKLCDIDDTRFNLTCERVLGRKINVFD